MRLILILLLLHFSVNSFAAEAGSAAQNTPSRTDIESLIDNSGYNALLSMYKNAVIFFVVTKTKVPECAKNPNCMAYWNNVKLDLMKDNPTFIQNSKTKMTDLLAKRYSQAQIKWLLEIYKNPLFKDFNNFFDSDNSPLPLQDARVLLESKKKNIKPFAAGLAQPSVQAQLPSAPAPHK